MATYRYGEVRTDFALRIGVARKASRIKPPPFDLWLRALSPSAELEERFHTQQLSFAQFAAAYRAEMRRTEPHQLIDFIAFFAQEESMSLGCFCEREDMCHRSLLQRLIEDATPSRSLWMGRRESTSPVCLLGDADF